MTSRERVIAALNRKSVDRVPIDFGGTGTTGINVYVYKSVREQLGIAGNTLVVAEPLSQLAKIEPQVNEAVGGDTVVLWRQTPCLGLRVRDFYLGSLDDGTPAYIPESFNPRPNEKGDMVYYFPENGDDLVHPFPKEGGRQSLAGRPVSICPKGQRAFSRVFHPLKGVDSLEKLKKYDFPVMDREELDYIEKNAKDLYENTDKAICGVFNGNMFELGQLYWGYEDFFCNLMLEDDMMDYFYDYRFELMMEDLKNYLAACGKYIQSIEFTEDLGTQTSLLIAPEVYRRRIKPLHKKMFDYIHTHYPDVKILLHSCGAVRPLIPDFIEIGADALNPVQISAVGMNPKELVSEFGKDITFWGGGVDTQSTLCSKTPDEVKVEVNKNLDEFTKGAGYIFTQVHNVEASVPGENLLAAFLTAKNYKKR